MCDTTATIIWASVGFAIMCLTCFIGGIVEHDEPDYAKVGPGLYLLGGFIVGMFWPVILVAAIAIAPFMGLFFLGTRAAKRAKP